MVLTEPIELEFATLSDAHAISVLSRDEIEHGLGWYYTPQRVSRIIKHRAKNTVVARSGNTLLGFAVMSYGESQANLDLLAVNPNYRRNRVGSKLVLWLEEVATTAGAYNVFVQLRSKNLQARAFYKVLRYSKLEILPRFYRGHEHGLLMAKSLRPMVVPD